MRAMNDLADRLRSAFPAWRREVAIRDNRIFMGFGCGHKISGSYMQDCSLVIASLEPALWPEAT